MNLGRDANTASFVSKAHRDLHFRKTLTLVASTDSVHVGRIWRQVKMSEGTYEFEPAREDNPGEDGKGSPRDASFAADADDLEGGIVVDAPSLSVTTYPLPCLGRDTVRAWQMQGFSLANVVVLERYDGWVLLDAAESTGTNLETLSSLLKLITTAEPPHCYVDEPAPPDRNVTHVLISHHHTDHVGGIQGVKIWNSGREPAIIVHELTEKALLSFYSVLVKTKFKRAVKQFGSSLEDYYPTFQRISAGIGASYPLSEDDPPQVIFPTHTWSGKTSLLKVGDHLTIELVLMPGETEDQVCFFIENLSLFHFADNFYFSFPNVYPIRGGTHRSPVIWKESMDIFLHRYWSRTRVVTVGHTSAVFGKSAIRYIVERYRDALAFVHHQTVRLLDKTSNLDLIADHVNSLFWSTFPAFDVAKMLDDSEDITEDQMLNRQTLLNMLTDPLMPFYGQLEWAVKAIGTAAIGWFDENPKHLNSHRLSPADRANKLSNLIFGSANRTISPNEYLEARIAGHIESGECQWALELIDLFFTSRNQGHIKEPIPINQCQKPAVLPSPSPVVVSSSSTPVPTLFEGQAAATRIAKQTTGAAIADEAIELVSHGLKDLNQDESSTFDSAANNSAESVSAAMHNRALDGESVTYVLTENPAKTITGRQNIDELIRQQWELTHCTDFDDMLQREKPVVTSSTSSEDPLEDSEGAECLRKRALWCLADTEISSSGRNWYLSEVADTDALPGRDKMMKSMRDMVVANLADLDPIVRGLSFRFIPFGNKRDPKETFIFYLSLTPDEESSSSVDATQNGGLDLKFFKPVRLAPQTTYEILYRNQVFNVRRIDSAADMDWDTVRKYRSFDLNLTWSGIKAIFLRKQRAPSLIMDGKLHLPTEYPVPMIALQQANEDDDVREKVRSVFEKKGKLTLIERIRAFILFAELMLSLDAM